MSTIDNTFSPPRLVAWGFAGTFALAGFMAYMPNPLVGPDAIFATNGMHNVVHLMTALGFGAFAMVGDRASILFMKGFGTVYLLVAVLGAITLGGDPEGMLLGVVHINQMDNVLHGGLAISILAAGFGLARTR